MYADFVCILLYLHHQRENWSALQHQRISYQIYFMCVMRKDCMFGIKTRKYARFQLIFVHIFLLFVVLFVVVATIQSAVMLPVHPSMPAWWLRSSVPWWMCNSMVLYLPSWTLWKWQLSRYAIVIVEYYYYCCCNCHFTYYLHAIIYSYIFSLFLCIFARVRTMTWWIIPILIAIAIPIAIAGCPTIGVGSSPAFGWKHRPYHFHGGR